MTVKFKHVIGYLYRFSFLKIIDFIDTLKNCKLVLQKSTFKARFHYERGKEHSLFVLLIFFALASILTARFNRRSIKETKNALFHARSGNGPLQFHRRN